jgi:hypothetical protein
VWRWLRDPAWLIGAILSAPAIISLIQHIFDIGLIPVLEEAVAFYRAIVHPIVQLVRDLLPWLPERPVLIPVDPANRDGGLAGDDLYVLSVAGANILFRSAATKFQASPHPAPFHELVIIWLLSVAVVGLTGFGVVMMFGAAAALPYPLLRHWLYSDDDFWSPMSQAAWATLVSVGSFYVSNFAGQQF